MILGTAEGRAKTQFEAKRFAATNDAIGSAFAIGA